MSSVLYGSGKLATYDVIDLFLLGSLRCVSVVACGGCGIGNVCVCVCVFVVCV